MIILKCQRSPLFLGLSEGEGRRGDQIRPPPAGGEGKVKQPVPFGGVPNAACCPVPEFPAMFLLSWPFVLLRPLASIKSEPRDSVGLTPGSLYCRVINCAYQPGTEEAPRTGAVLLVILLHVPVCCGPKRSAQAEATISEGFEADMH